MEVAASPLLLQAHIASLPVHQPKGRGRPRASYAQTGEFDLGLIREYRSRPALYDRSNKRFKDKMYTAQLWMQISHKLGYDVSILRDRMITLRNRYNIEKRRVENNALPNCASQWPLFENLSFLSDHIRSRRSYKTQCKSLDGQPDDEDDEEPFDVDDMNSESNELPKCIKHELDADYEEIDDYDCDGQLPVTTMLSIPNSSTPINGISNSSCNNSNSNSNLLNDRAAHQQLSNCRQSEQLLRVAKPKRSPPALEEDAPAAKRRLEESHATAPASAAAATTAAAAAASAAKATTTAASTTYPKFRAFGEFVSHSLNELPHSMSMRLIEKFTRELVQASIANEQCELQKPKSVDASTTDEEED
uniref:Jing interacting gene regulatory 1 n=1 Tax=Drosophila buzzatii TaxID=7264 RepID=I3RSE9_DROBU|nr:jing interacting gene regulatory 1 [Drosophila buzzatii]